MKKFLNGIASAIADRIVPADTTEADRLRDKAFDRAKRTSDFIGMVVRFAFANYAVAYFFNAWKVAPNGPGVGDHLHKWALAISSMVTLGLMVYFGWQIFEVITAHFMRDAASQRGRTSRIIIFISVTVTSIAIWVGINELVSAIPKPGAKS